VRVRAEIAELQRRTGTTMLYVTHDQVEAMTLGQRVAVMHQGRLQQLAAPRELYARPTNLFVAGFIGSPPMNLLPARLAAGAGGALALEVEGQSLPLPGALAAAARALGEGELTLGLRPEALRLAPPARPGALRARVLFVEFLGHELLAHLALEGARAGAPPLVARLADGVAPGRDEPVEVEVDPEGVQLFGSDGSALPPT